MSQKEVAGDAEASVKLFVIELVLGVEVERMAFAFEGMELMVLDAELVETRCNGLGTIDIERQDRPVRGEAIARIDGDGGVVGAMNHAQGRVFLGIDESEVGDPTPLGNGTGHSWRESSVFGEAGSVQRPTVGGLEGLRGTLVLAQEHLREDGDGACRVAQEENAGRVDAIVLAMRLEEAHRRAYVLCGHVAVADDGFVGELPNGQQAIVDGGRDVAVFCQAGAVFHHVNEVAASGHKSPAEDGDDQWPRRERVARRFVEVEIQGGGFRGTLAEGTAEGDAGGRGHVVEDGLRVALSRLGKSRTRPKQEG